MEDKKIQYENKNLESSASAQSSSRTSLIDFLIKRGWVKNEQQAMYLIVAFIGICILVIILLSVGGGYEYEDPDNFIPVM